MVGDEGVRSRGDREAVSIEGAGERAGRVWRGTRRRSATRRGGSEEDRRIGAPRGEAVRGV